MSTIRRLLVPIDFSKASISAYHEAVRIARDSGARVLVAHVYQIPVAASLSYGPVVVFEDLDRSVRRVAETRLQAFVEEARRHGVDSHALVLCGSAAEEILTAAEKNRVDLIVMGTRGRSGAAHFLAASVAARIVAGAHCPVLTVRPASPEESTDTYPGEFLHAGFDTDRPAGKEHAS